MAWIDRHSVHIKSFFCSSFFGCFWQVPVFSMDTKSETDLSSTKKECHLTHFTGILRCVLSKHTLCAKTRGSHDGLGGRSSVDDTMAMWGELRVTLMTLAIEDMGKWLEEGTLPPWEHMGTQETFIFRGYNPYIGPKTFIFHVFLGSKGWN